MFKNRGKHAHHNFAVIESLAIFFPSFERKTTETFEYQIDASDSYIDRLVIK